VPKATTRLAVPDVHCDHCKQMLERAVGALDGVSSVEVDVAGRIVTVTHEPGRTPAPRIAAAIEEQGYELAGQEEAP
jgi:copper chaperone CopZ